MSRKMSDSQDEQGKMFVGGLSWETTQEALSSYFSRFGEVVDSVVMKNGETGRSRGFGFVTFKDPSCVQIVLSNGPHSLDSRTIDPKACNPRGMQPVSAPRPRKGELPKIFLGGLPSNINETDLRSFFSKFGKVLEVVIMYDQEKNRSRGFGFLSFEKEDIVDRVCAEQFFTINGKQVECKKAEPRSGRPMGGRPNHWNSNGQGDRDMAPHMGGPPMGPSAVQPMTNGMGYQASGWGPPMPYVSCAPQGPYGPPAAGAAYPAWSPQPSPYYGSPSSPYGPPVPAYSAYGYGYQWPVPQEGVSPMQPAVAQLNPLGSPGSAYAYSSNNYASMGQQPLVSAAGPPAPAASAPSQTVPTPNAPSSKQEPAVQTAAPYEQGGDYRQDDTMYGPTKPSSDQGGYNAAGNSSLGTGDAPKINSYNGGTQGGSSGRSGAHSQNYHPYRRP